MRDPFTTIHHLEMTGPEAFRPGQPKAGLSVSLVQPPDPAVNRKFYSAVGADWNWTDRLAWSDDDWRKYVCRDDLATYLGTMDGETIGYFELERQDGSNIEIKYFGLLPAHIGRGLGGAFLSMAVRRAWEWPGARRVWVHTCTKDHENALANYQKRGFTVFKTERAPNAEPSGG